MGKEQRGGGRCVCRAKLSYQFVVFYSDFQKHQIKYKLNYPIK